MTKLDDLYGEIKQLKADLIKAGAMAIGYAEKLAECEKERDELRTKVIHYDRWLSGGVYFTTEEYKAEVARHKTVEAELSQLKQNIAEAEPVAYRWFETKFDEWRYGEEMFSSRTNQSLYDRPAPPIDKPTLKRLVTQVFGEGYAIVKLASSEDQRLDLCPCCGGKADNGYDRCSPPNPYYCTKCNKEMMDYEATDD